MYEILYDYVCDELEEVERDGLKASNLDSTDKLLNIKKNLLKIRDMEESDGYSNASRSRHYVRGHYSYDNGNYNNGYSNRYMPMNGDMRNGNSYRSHDGRGGRNYSYADGKDGMMEHLHSMMGDAQSEEERKIIKDAMSKFEKL